MRADPLLSLAGALTCVVGAVTVTAAQHLHAAGAGLLAGGTLLAIRGAWWVTRGDTRRRGGAGHGLSTAGDGAQYTAPRNRRVR